MTMSLDGARDLLAEHSGEAWVALYSIDHDALIQPMRLVAGSAEPSSPASSFTRRRPSTPQWPAEEPDRPAQGRLVLQAVDQTILSSLQTLDGPLEVDIELCRSSAPDTVELGWYGLLANRWRTDLARLEAELSAPQHAIERVPWIRLTRDRFRCCHDRDQKYVGIPYRDCGRDALD